MLERVSYNDFKQQFKSHMASEKYVFLDLKGVNAPYEDELAEAAARVVRSGRYIGGEEVERLEEKIGEVCRTPYAVAVSNGLDALRLILRASVELGRIPRGAEVIVPANTYIATVLAVRDAGLVPVLADVDLLTSNLRGGDALEALVTPRTAAVMPVHLYGRVAWDEALADMARRRGLLVVEDNAQAIGAVSPVEGLHGTFVTGGLGDAAGMSFYPTKNVGALGDAGAVTTHDAELAATVRALANYGAPRRYDNRYEGFNCRMDSIQAAMLTVKLAHLEEENADRRRRAAVYRSVISNPAVRLPLDAGEGHVYHQFVVHTDDRRRFCDYLDANGVGWDIHYAVPAHLQPCYAGSDRLVFPQGGLLVTERLAATCVSLPITRCTSMEDAAKIGKIIDGYAVL